MPGAATEYVLTLSCPDRVGIVHAVAAYLHRAGCNVLDSQQFGDRIAGRFFMRVHVETVPGAPVTRDQLTMLELGDTLLQRRGGPRNVVLNRVEHFQRITH